MSMADALALSLWQSISENVENMACSIPITFADSFAITSSDAVDLDVRNLVTVNFFTVSDNDALSSLNLAGLTTAGAVNLNDNDAITSVSFGSLTTLGVIFLNACAALASINLPSLLTCTADFNCQSNPSLANFSAPLWLPSDGTILSFPANALTQASVDHILARCVANPAYVSGSVDLSGGTSSPPGAQGQADVLTLQGRGVFVSTN